MECGDESGQHTWCVGAKSKTALCIQVIRIGKSVGGLGRPKEGQSELADVKLLVNTNC